MFVLNQNNVYFEQIHKININKRLKLIKKKKKHFHLRRSEKINFHFIRNNIKK